LPVFRVLAGGWCFEHGQRSQHSFAIQRFVKPIGLWAAYVNDNSKKYLAVINSGSNRSGGNRDLQLFKFDSTTSGKLDPIATATTGTEPTNPQSLVATH
jgi:hypothetical protein